MAVFPLKRAKNTETDYYSRMYSLMGKEKGLEMSKVPNQRVQRLSMDELVRGFDIYTSKVHFEDIIYPNDVKLQIEGLLEEFRNMETLRKFKLPFSNKILFHGPSGCGKTLTAMALARSLDKKICVINLSTIIDSGLGKTANNIYSAVESASSEDAVIFFDEFDALAKARNDSKDLGEIKRVASSLLQILDNLDNESTFIAATNYIEVLDKAIVRRFNKVIEFKLPRTKEKKLYINKLINHSGLSVKSNIIDSLCKMIPNKSYAEIRDWVMNKLKRYILDKTKTGKSLKEIDKDILKA